ncbi:hypothetical protein MUCCIDRAFT_161118 [Mucor lusitanicus CBS 277.49]|uniref:Uncharacterized protein n=2 Tax=Mucor circinelloides f. lusitanicus TaxID=29924 RepID=A0A162RDN6_MUCCL|nr:hypothetical protein MUCCIDRAFT_161118 [Mucor lusitanicus CBS 277.49]
MSNNTTLKRTRSTESLEKAFKRARPFHAADSPASVSTSEPISTSTAEPSSIVYPSIKTPSSPALLETISISTKTDASIPSSAQSSPSTHQPLPDYSHVNGLLHSLHVQRFGDPESRESWWEAQDPDIDMEETNDEYATANSILRQAFLQRRHYG